MPQSVGQRNRVHRAGRCSLSDDVRNECILHQDVNGFLPHVGVIDSVLEGTASSVLGRFHIPEASTFPLGGDAKRDFEGRVP